MEISQILLCLLVILIEITKGTEDCTKSKTICQVRTAIAAGVASVLDAISHKEYAFETKSIALLGYYTNPGLNFCLETCSTETSVGDLDQIDQLITNGQLQIEKLKKEHLSQIANIMGIAHEDINIMISILKDKGDLFQFKIGERLKQDNWFVSLQVRKQSLLTKYAQSRMFQKETLNNLKEIHSMNQGEKLEFFLTKPNTRINRMLALSKPN